MTDLPRASHADRQHTTDLLDLALAEGRIDAAEHETRTGTAERARDPQILAGLVADLPDRPGVRDWTNRLRVRAADRRNAVTWLGDALADANRFVAFTYLGVLHTLSPVDGTVVSEVPVDGWINYPMHTDLRLLPGRYAVSNYHSTTETPPALMIG
ncbi:DUF1707 domain-containing protein [Actinoplanes hulinensis]|uniref:DUF1707 domain-containing protein n=1 Tax=Actinoplanes hulinensis TaxID=1144547 RepID=A0ABS7B4C9_9ACTN|nr:DUF1707 domain-containing protein [Actinoplanes hulinensis]MBW6435870.1 DUF1707 domain-containing protein [Actinoplanes hulinensis]